MSNRYVVDIRVYWLSDDGDCDEVGSGGEPPNGWETSPSSKARTRRRGSRTGCTRPEGGCAVTGGDPLLKLPKDAAIPTVGSLRRSRKAQRKYQGSLPPTILCGLGSSSSFQPQSVNLLRALRARPVCRDVAVLAYLDASHLLEDFRQYRPVVPVFDRGKQVLVLHLPFEPFGKRISHGCSCRSASADALQKGAVANFCDIAVLAVFSFATFHFWERTREDRKTKAEHSCARSSRSLWRQARRVEAAAKAVRIHRATAYRWCDQMGLHKRSYRRTEKK